MSVRVPFSGGCFILSEAMEFTGNNGERVKLEAAVVIVGVKSKAIRIPIEVMDASGALVNTDEYKEFVKKVRQQKP